MKTQTRSAWLRLSIVVALLQLVGVTLTNAAARAGVLPCGGFISLENLPATGVTTGTIIGEDGNPPCGKPLSFHDNRDGTISDLNTGLMWEKKDNSSNNPSSTDIHNAANQYPWKGTCSNSPSTECGTDDDCSGGGTCQATDGQGSGLTIFGFVAELNDERFAGHRDWRVPNIRELASIVDYGAIAREPQVTAAFNRSGCALMCTDITSQNCSCTGLFRSWSSTRFSLDSTFAWHIFFLNGGDAAAPKTDLFQVRAVRGQF